MGETLLIKCKEFMNYLIQLKQKNWAKISENSEFLLRTNLVFEFVFLAKKLL